MLPQSRSVALIALGSNAPPAGVDATEVLQSAIEGLGHDCGVIRGASDFYATPAFPAGSGPDFVNAAVVVDTALPPAALLRAMHRIESALGRTRRQRWAPRSLDLDLIAVGDRVLPDVEYFAVWRDLPLDRQSTEIPETLILPHPRLQDRAFVLVPLAQAMVRAGCDWQHPVSGVSVPQMLSALPQAARDAIKPL